MQTSPGALKTDDPQFLKKCKKKLQTLRKWCNQSSRSRVQLKRTAGDSNTDASKRAPTSEPPEEHHRSDCRRVWVEQITARSPLSPLLSITTARTMCMQVWYRRRSVSALRAVAPPPSGAAAYLSHWGKWNIQGRHRGFKVRQYCPWAASPVLLNTSQHTGTTVLLQYYKAAVCHNYRMHYMVLLFDNKTHNRLQLNFL